MNYYIQKIFSFLLTIFLVALVTFSVFQILPGDPALAILGIDADPIQIETFRSSMNLDKPAIERFFIWLSNVLRGDLGQSYRYKVSVVSIVFNSFFVTAQLSFIVLFITILFGLPIGSYLALNDNKKYSMPISFITQLGVSFPSFCSGIFFIYVFSVKLSLLPSMGYVPFSTSPLDCIKSLILPSISLAFGTTSILIRYMRSSVLNQLKEDYVRTAKSKGMNDFFVFFHHIFRNSLISAITILGMLTAEILGGSIIIENVFSLPGIGKLLASSILSRDYPLIQGLVLYISFIVIFCNFMVDILYSIVDPRIRIRGAKK